MAHGERVGPEGLSIHSEDVGVQTSLFYPVDDNLPNSNAAFSNDVPNTSRDEYLHSSNYIHPTTSMEDLYRSMSQSSINDNNQYRQDIELNNQEILPTSHDVPVCLHQGTQGGSPVLITLPFQTMDNLQTFIPCSTCHKPNNTSPSIRASNIVAFCVSEVNIRTSQLTLVPCFLCWKPAYPSLNNVPNKITVPLFPTLSTNNEENRANEESIRFVPCGVCLQEDHDILDYPNSTQAQQPFNHPPLESELEENQFPEHSHSSLTNTRTYFKPLRTNGTSESVREFMTQTSPNLCDEIVEEDDEKGDLPVAWFVPFSNVKKPSEVEQPLTLQRAFLKHCTNVVKNSKQRQRSIPELAQLRMKTVKISAKSQQENKNHSSKKYMYNFGSCPPFTHKEMRQQTERIYRRLPEAYESQRQKLREELNQTHRLMAYLFQKKLQRATLKGKVSWEITESCL